MLISHRCAQVFSSSNAPQPRQPMWCANMATHFASPAPRKARWADHAATRGNPGQGSPTCASDGRPRSRQPARIGLPANPAKRVPRHKNKTPDATHGPKTVRSSARPLSAYHARAGSRATRRRAGHRSRPRASRPRCQTQGQGFNAQCRAYHQDWAGHWRSVARSISGATQSWKRPQIARGRARPKRADRGSTPRWYITSRAHKPGPYGRAGRRPGPRASRSRRQTNGHVFNTQWHAQGPDCADH